MPKRWLPRFSGLFDYLGCASAAQPGLLSSIRQQHLRGAKLLVQIVFHVPARQ
jgi:hypothetical protein